MLGLDIRESLFRGIPSVDSWGKRLGELDKVETTESCRVGTTE